MLSFLRESKKRKPETQKYSENHKRHREKMLQGVVWLSVRGSQGEEDVRKATIEEKVVY